VSVWGGVEGSEYEEGGGAAGRVLGRDARSGCERGEIAEGKYSLTNE
jgi:hypothetical protein